MHTSSCYNAYMKGSQSRQYTIRNIPEYIDQVLGQHVKDTRKSFNQVALEALISGVGKSPPKRNLSVIVGSMSAKQATVIEQDIRDQRHVDWNLWQ